MSSASSFAPFSGKILLVEDNEDDVFFFRLLSRKAGIAHDIAVAHDGEHAVSLLTPCASAGAVPPLVTFVDLKLPKLFGFEVLKWMRTVPALESMLKVVLTSSYEDRDVLEAFSLGADAYLVKYPTPADLGAVLRAAEVPRAQRLHTPLPGVRRPVKR